MSINILQALELAGILTVTETDDAVTITLHIDKSTNGAPTLPAPVKRKRLGRMQRLALRMIEAHGPMIEDVTEAMVLQSVRNSANKRDTRQQTARHALRSLVTRGLATVDGEIIRLVSSLC